MALVKCPECGGKVSTSAKACPKCGAPPPDKPINHKGGNGDHIPTWQGLLIIIGVVVGFIAYANFTSSPGTSSTSSTRNEFTELDALYMCQSAIKAIAKDPENAKAPYVENFGSGNEYYFAWGRSTKFARMRNAFGNDMPVSASCIVDGTKRQITSLTVDGESVIGG